MQPETPKLLEDIRDNAAFILDQTSGITAEAYLANRLLRQSVERGFEVIGEAMRRLRDTDPDTMRQFSDYRQIIAFRNVLIHAYDDIDHSHVWQIIQGPLPTLLSEVELLLRE